MIIDLMSAGGWGTVLVATISVIAIAFALMPARFRAKAVPACRLATAAGLLVGIAQLGLKMDHIQASSYPGGREWPLLWGFLESLGPLVAALLGVAVVSAIEMVRSAAPVPPPKSAESE